MIKARPCAGDIAAGEAFLEEALAFHLAQISRLRRDRRHPLDEAADPRLRGHDEIAVEGHDIKLGRGGIREIEFFVQTQQLIAGGPQSGAARARDARRRSTTLAAGRLDRRATPRDDLGRGLSLPARRRAPPADGRRRADPHAAGGHGRRWSASRAFWASRIATRLRRRFSDTCAGAAALRAPVRGRAHARRGPAASSFTGEADDPATLDTLSAMGFAARSKSSARGARAGSSGDYRSLHGERARDAADRAGAGAARALRAHRKSRRARCRAFDRFLAGLHGGVQLLRCCAAIRTCSRCSRCMLGTAPRLADIARRSIRRCWTR